MTDIPRQDLLLKLLKMTTSDNDGEALTALRKANALLTSAGWDWDKLIEGKIRIVEDPFKNLGTPPGGGQRSAGHSFPDAFSNGQAQYAPPPPRTTPPPPPPPPFRGSPSTPISTTINRFPGFCWCCGVESVPGNGFIFKPTPSHSKWEVVCTPCNTTATVPRHAAIPIRHPRKRAVSDLA